MINFLKGLAGIVAGPLGGIFLALLVWCGAMFVWGDYYSFMQGTGTHDYDSAVGTRLVMLFAFIFGTIVTWAIICAEDDSGCDCDY